MLNSSLPINRRGTAFIIVLWLVALLSVIVLTFTVYAVNQAGLSRSYTDMHRVRRMTSGATQYWMARLRADLVPDGEGLMISEVMYQWRDRRHGGLIVTKVVHQPEEVWIELFNPTDSTFYIRNLYMARFGERMTRSLPVRIAPGGYAYWCEFIHCKDLDRDRENVRAVPKLALEKNGGMTLISATGDHDWVSLDALGWTSRSTFPFPSSLKKGSDLRSESEHFALVRRTNEDGYPVDTSNNRSDFKWVKQTEPGGYEFPNQRIPPRDVNEYVEFFNASDHPVDPTRGTLTERGETRETMKLTLHESMEGKRPDLAPGQVGLVVHEEVDLNKLDLRSRVEKGDLKLYGFGGEPEFENQLADHGNVQIELTSPGKRRVTDRVPVDGDTWSRKNLDPKHAREKKRLLRDNNPENWEVTLEGSPGDVPTFRGDRGEDRVDSWWENWGRFIHSRDPGGTAPRIYWPSMDRTRRDSDRGFVQFLTIQDESGKISLNHPRDPRRFYDSWLVDSGVMTRNQVDSFVETTEHRFLTPGDLLSLDYVNLSEYRRLKDFFTPYGESNPRKINLNTASYEVLRTIPISTQYGELDLMTRAMAMKIIERRSGIKRRRFKLSYPEDYLKPRPLRATPWLTVSGVCESEPFVSHPSFRCSTLRRYATVESEGVFRAVIRAVGLSENGRPRSVHRSEVYVRRSTRDKRNYRLEIIYRR